MGNVVMHNVVSVDGFIADEDDQVGPLFEWYGNGEHTLAGDREDTTGELKVSKASIDYVRPTWAAIGAMVIGRHLFDMTNGWEGRAARRASTWSWCRTGPSPRGGTPRRRTTSSTTWPRRSRRRRSSRGTARSRWPRATSAARPWRSGLVDEVAMDVVPVVFGSGKRYFGSVAAQHLLEDPDVVIRGDRVLHLRYRVRR